MHERWVKTEGNDVTNSMDLEHIFNLCKSLGYAFALYQLPGDKDMHVIIGQDPTNELDKVRLEDQGSGFLFHPYQANDHPIKFIEKDVHIIYRKDSQNAEIIHGEAVLEQMIRSYQSAPHTNQASPSQKNNITVQDILPQKNQHYRAMVQKAIDDIQSGLLQKVVLSRTKQIQLPETFHAIRFFKKLSAQYPNAFLYLVNIPDIGTWAGATPEILIEINAERQFKTIALAGTQGADRYNDIADATWSQKDIEEQAMVSRYIINCFKKIRLREFEEIGPRSHISGNLLHLKTEYRVNMDAVAFPDLGTIMLNLLHPTSAVCGMPKAKAMDFIAKNEQFDRAYFTGFLGPVHIADATHIYVNLRCMQINANQATLFAGAGIMENSVPEKEWKETELKMQTVFNVLQGEI